MFRRLLLPLPILLVACGPLAQERTNHRTERPNDSGPGHEVGGNPSQKPADSSPPAKKKPSTEAKTPSKNTEYDEDLDRTASAFFYQSEPELSDLFAANGTSQLCWPTAMSYTLEAFRTASQPALSALKKPTIRDLASRCGTDRKLGTTMPQGVSCLDAVLAEAGYTPNLKVTGLDAKWKSFGLYPEKTTASDSEVSPDVIRNELSSGSSVILFIGFYRLDPEKKIWNRLRGHFITVTGFGNRSSWDGEVLDLRVVNPANDYKAEAKNGVLKADVVRMSRIADLAPLPKDVAFELRGPRFEPGENAVAAVESILEINPN